MLPLTSCSTKQRLVVIPSSHEIVAEVRKDANGNDVPGYFVPQARMQELLDALNDVVLQKKKQEQ